MSYRGIGGERKFEVGFCRTIRCRDLLVAIVCPPASNPQYLFYPSIDPLSEKASISTTPSCRRCDEFGVDRARPIVTQVSRFDRLTDPVGVILWKGKPTVAGAVGGIPNQIIHKLTGVLVHSVEGCVFQIRDLLTHPEFARRIGMNGREHVRENFLVSGDVKRWLLLFRTLCGRSRRELQWTRQPDRQFLHRAHVVDFPDSLRAPE
jgi:hypothetical protein